MQKYISHGIILSEHEQHTVTFFLQLGETIELIPPSNTPHVRRPDFIMHGIEWEMKAILKSSPNNLKRTFYHALGQSTNLVFDLRNIKENDEKVYSNLLQLFHHSRKVRKLIILRKNSQYIQLSKK